MSARRRRGGMIGSGSKGLEKEFIRKARFLANNPDVIIPECRGKCLMCPFASIKKQIHRIAEFADDEEKLVSYSKRGDLLARAYAATLLIGVRKKIPYTAQLKTPVGIISYVMWGKSTKDKIIGVQYYDNPELRLLAVSDIVKKKGIVIYSTEKKMICTGKVMEPPEEFIDFVTGSRGIKLKKTSSGYGCPHSSETAFTGISIKWHSAHMEIRICKECAARKDMNTLHHIAGKIAARKVLDDFSVEVIKKLSCKASDCSLCDVGEWDGYQDYLDAAIKDSEIIDRYEKEHYSKAIKDRGVYVIGNDCYGTNASAFIKALSPSDVERKALRAMLKRYKRSVVLERPSVNKVLSYGWPKYASAMLMAVVKDKEIVKRVMKEKHRTASEAIVRALVIKKEKDQLAAYPKVKYNSRAVELLDTTARLYKIGEIDAIDVVVEGMSHEDLPRLMAIKMAIYTALGKAESNYWKYPTNESELGRYLGPMVKEFFDSSEGDYVEKMQAVLSAAALNDIVEVDK